MKSGDGRKKILIRLAAALLLGGWFVALWRWNVPPNLLDRAIRTALTSDHPYQWLNANEALVFEEPQVPGQVWHLYRVNIHTGAKSPLTALQERIGAIADLGSMASVSPDGKLLLVHRGRKDRVFTLEGSLFQTWSIEHDVWDVQLDPHAQAVWQSDSRHIAYFNDNKISSLAPMNCQLPVFIRDVASQQTTHKQEMPYPPEFQASAYYTEPRMTAGGSLYAFAPIREASETRALLIVSAPPRLAQSKFSIQAPSGLRFLASSDMLFAPDEQRIAWICGKPDAMSNLQRRAQLQLYELFPRLNKGYTVTSSLFVSQIDGSKSRNLGEIQTRLFFGDNSQQDIIAIKRLAWLPDGKHLSFEVNGHVYLVAVD